MPFPRFLARMYAPNLKSRALRFVGRTSIADLEHVGRRSGKTRHTPVRAFRNGEKVMIGLNFGRESDWMKNVAAAQRCRIRLHGQQMELNAPRIVPIAEGMKGMPTVFGLGLRYLVRTRDCLELTVVSSVPVADVEIAGGGTAPAVD